MAKKKSTLKNKKESNKIKSTDKYTHGSNLTESNPVSISSLIKDNVLPNNKRKNNIEDLHLKKSSFTVDNSIIENTVDELSESYLPVNFNDFKGEDQIGGLLENNKLGCAAVNLEYDSKLIEKETHNPCIYYVLKGKIKARVNKSKKFILKKGDVLELDKKQHYEFKCNSKNGCRLLMCYYK